MATSEKTNDKLSLSSVAFELFKARSAHSGVTPHQLAIDCLRDAKAFLAAMEEVLAGEIELLTEAANPLDSAFAPNLAKSHPLNLMSRTWGDLKKVQATLSDLDANPAAEFYEPYGWGKPEVNQARALFPAVVNRAKQIATTK